MFLFHVLPALTAAIHTPEQFEKLHTTASTGNDGDNYWSLAESTQILLLEKNPIDLDMAKSIAVAVNLWLDILLSMVYYLP